MLVRISQWIHGFGGMQDRFDLIFPPTRIADILTGSIGLVSVSVPKVGLVICGLLLLGKEGPESYEKKLQN